MKDQLELFVSITKPNNEEFIKTINKNDFRRMPYIRIEKISD